MKIDPATGLAALPDGYRFFVERSKPRYEFLYGAVVELHYYNTRLDEWKMLKSHCIHALNVKEIENAASVLSNWLEDQLGTEHLLGAYPPNKLP